MCDGNCSFYDRGNNRKSPSPKFRVSVIELEPYCKPSSCTLMPGSNFCSIPVSFAFLTLSRRRFPTLIGTKMASLKCGHHM